ncbi:PREDICTED: tumor necrosis factor receptor superfamily member 25, partial [Condylura cristata]|uniref:tumor necrosis factor receptor superfamily member 25 n=1 Tax=Condylura cristata TaxID=143302 RepID=UPI0006435F15
TVVVSPTTGSRTAAECGACLPGFHEHAGHCVSCPTTTLGRCPEPCVAICGWRQMFWMQLLLASLAVLLLLGAVLTYVYCCCRPSKPRVAAEQSGVEAWTPLQVTHSSPPECARALLVPPSEKAHLENGRTPCAPQEVPWGQLPCRALGPTPLPAPPPAPPAGAAASVLQPGAQLYDVADAVPARRWKEFVRTLGLREAEIEAVEVEVGRFRDQQYEMLKRWRQQQPADLRAVYAALERMGLDGCAEDLRSRLQQRGP